MKCIYCENDAVYLALTAEYKEEQFCRKCFLEDVAPRSYRYVMIVDLTSKKTMSQSDLMSTYKIEKVEVRKQAPAVKEFIAELKQFLPEL